MQLMLQHNNAVPWFWIWCFYLFGKHKLFLIFWWPWRLKGYYRQQAKCVCRDPWPTEVKGPPDTNRESMQQSLRVIDAQFNCFTQNKYNWRCYKLIVKGHSVKYIRIIATCMICHLYGTCYKFISKQVSLNPLNHQLQVQSLIRVCASIYTAYAMNQYYIL